MKPSADADIHADTPPPFSWAPMGDDCRSSRGALRTVAVRRRALWGLRVPVSRNKNNLLLSFRTSSPTPSSQRRTIVTAGGRPEGCLALTFAFQAPVKEPSTCRGGEFALHARLRRAEARQPSLPDTPSTDPPTMSCRQRNPLLSNIDPLLIRDPAWASCSQERQGRREPSPGHGIIAVKYTPSIARRASTLDV